jgi:hypothetical protein
MERVLFKAPDILLEARLVLRGEPNRFGCEVLLVLAERIGQPFLKCN